MAKIIFDNNTDYSDVYRITQLIYGDVAALSGTTCCNETEKNTAFCRTAAYLRAADIADDESDTPRYENAVKIAYLTIYPFAINDYNP